MLELAVCFRWKILLLRNYNKLIGIFDELFTGKINLLTLIEQVKLILIFFYSVKILGFVTALILVSFLKKFHLECIKKVILQIFL